MPRVVAVQRPPRAGGPGGSVRRRDGDCPRSATKSTAGSPSGPLTIHATRRHARRCPEPTGGCHAIPCRHPHGAARPAPPSPIRRRGTRSSQGQADSVGAGVPAAPGRAPRRFGRAERARITGPAAPRGGDRGVRAGAARIGALVAATGIRAELRSRTVAGVRVYHLPHDPVRRDAGARGWAAGTHPRPGSPGGRAVPTTSDGCSMVPAGRATVVPNPSRTPTATSTGFRSTRSPAPTRTSSWRPGSRRSTDSSRSCVVRSSRSSPAPGSPPTLSRRGSPPRRELRVTTTRWWSSSPPWASPDVRRSSSAPSSWPVEPPRAAFCCSTSPTTRPSSGCSPPGSRSPWPSTSPSSWTATYSW